MSPDVPAGRILLGRELRANLRGFAVWLIPIALLLALVCAMQPSFGAKGGLLAAKLQAMPEALRKAFGLGLADFTHPATYLATNFVFVTLTAGLFAARLGAGLIAKEEVLHTAELLYAQPVSRTRILGGKAAALAVYTLAYPLALAAIAIPVLAAVVDQPLEPGLLLSLFAGAAAIAACFAGAGMLAAVVVPDKRAAGGAALAIVVGTYLIGAVSAIAEPVAALRWLSPYRIVEPAAIVARGGLDPVATGALVAAGVAFGLTAVVRYRRQDIHA